MGLLDIDLNDVQEPKAVKEGEYMVRIVDLNNGTDKNGHPYLQAVLDIPTEPAAKNFTHFLGLPWEGMEAKAMNSCKWRLKLFFDAFKVDTSRSVDTEGMKGAQAWAILGMNEDDQFGPQNFVKKFVKSA